MTDEQRLVLYELGETLIPSAPGGLSADEAGVAGHFADRVLLLRPDLHAPLLRILDAGAEQPPRAYCEQIRHQAPEDFELLTFVVAAAYFLNPQVRRSYAYQGQVGEPQDGSTQPEYAEGGLLDPVTARGAIYRSG